MVTSTNPYAPAGDSGSSTRKGRLVFIWNALILAICLAFAFLPVRFLVSYYGSVVGGENPSSDAWSVFALQAANILSVTLGVLLVLTSFSTMPLNRRPMLTRAIAISACVLISLDFHLLRWRVVPEHPARAMIFAAMMPTLIVFWLRRPTCGKLRFSTFSQSRS